MNYILALTLILVVTTVVVGIYGIKNQLDGKKTKTFLGFNMLSFFTLMIGAAFILLGGTDVIAAPETGGLVETATSSTEGLKFIAAALSTGLASIGAGIAVAVTGSAAIGAISENEKLLGKTVIFVGLAEGIAIYGLIISIMVLGS
jgi:V/A-type H+-transporting ATPase subunit K